MAFVMGGPRVGYATGGGAGYGGAAYGGAAGIAGANGGYAGAMRGPNGNTGGVCVGPGDELQVCGLRRRFRCCQTSTGFYMPDHHMLSVESFVPDPIAVLALVWLDLVHLSSLRLRRR